MATLVTSIADDWIACAQYPNPNCVPDDVFERGYVLDDLANEQPELAWAVVKDVVSRYSEADLFTDNATEARRILAVLAAGPIENLLAEHGRSLIENVETEARRDRRLFWTLGCVWKNSMPDDVWERVQRAAGGVSR